MSENAPESPLQAAALSPEPDKRVIFEHTNGPLKGLRAIMGARSRPLPDHAKGFEAQGRQVAFASLIKVEQRYALYREAPLQSDGKHFPQRVR